MPLYEFECSNCSHVFELLIDRGDEDKPIGCQKCGEEAKRLISSFAHSVANGSSTEPIDSTIGRLANNRWQAYHDKQSRRRQDKDLKEIPSPQMSDGKFAPVMALGNKEEKTKRKEYSEILQETRTEYRKKGQSQFDGPGEF